MVIFKKISEVKPGDFPGVAEVIGANTPYGSNNFSNPSWTQFAYLTFTELLGDHERALIHANIGVNYAKPETDWRYSVNWGLGTQIRLIGGLHYVAGIFYGDPHSGDSGSPFQTGFPYLNQRKNTNRRRSGLRPLGRQETGYYDSAKHRKSKQLS
jgi:hypothetical protein